MTEHHEHYFFWLSDGDLLIDLGSDPPPTARCVDCGISYAAFRQQRYPGNPLPGTGPAPIPAAIQAAFDEAVSRSEWRFRL